ncbi:MICOS complex subunit Mic60 isoform X1 [Schistocerca serialis cubense]|uniref:MICOS complex subunit Mic60 isoform X1 n=1 Tax=Schistocerca serialis cubense TaxID=2023355 RepID=UPI00214EB6C6|nr:MICOS complex subunit Mic60 isoform X1 [Schistocerca serialis cubense]
MLRVAVKFVYRGPPRVLRCNTAKLHISSRNLQSTGSENTRGRGRAGKFFYFLGTITLASGGTVAYANYDPEFRRWLEANVPYAGDAFNVVLRDNNALYTSLNNYVSELKNQVLGLISRKEDKSPPTKPRTEPKPVLEETNEKKAHKTPAKVLPSFTNAPTEPQSAKAEVRLLPDCPPPPPETAPEQARPTAAAASDKLPPAQPQNVSELEQNVMDSVKLAISAYREAACACKEHGKDIGHIVEESIERIDSNVWSQLKSKAEKREAALVLSQERAKTATESIEKLRLFVEDSKADISEAQKETIKQNIMRLQEELAIAAKGLEVERQRADVTDKYWRKVEEARRHFAEELEVLIPSFKITDRKLKIAEGDLDLFILHAFRTVLYYQKELQKLETLYDQRLQIALEKTGGAVDKAIVIAEVEAELERERRKLDAEFQKKSLGLKAEAERELRMQLKRQAEAHSDHLHDALALREVELSRKYQRTADERIAEEQAKYKLQIASMMGRLKGLETALRARAEADKKAAQAQLLWSAAQSLHSALKAGVPGEPWTRQLRPLEDDVLALRKAAVEGDELVEAVLAAIPKEAVSRGVYPEDALRERFLKVERIARRLALLPESGGSLPLYFFSYLQSLFLINAVDPIPQAELSDEPVNLAHLDTFDILQRARYWLDRGNFTQTLKYMNLLKGASRQIASDWMNETRILLETQQAAGTLLAHAAAAGLIHL